MTDLPNDNDPDININDALVNLQQIITSTLQVTREVEVLRQTEQRLTTELSRAREVNARLFEDMMEEERRSRKQLLKAQADVVRAGFDSNEPHFLVQHWRTPDYNARVGSGGKTNVRAAVDVRIFRDEDLIAYFKNIGPHAGVDMSRFDNVIEGLKNNPGDTLTFLVKEADDWRQITTIQWFGSTVEPVSEPVSEPDGYYCVHAFDMNGLDHIRAQCPSYSDLKKVLLVDCGLSPIGFIAYLPKTARRLQNDADAVWVWHTWCGGELLEINVTWQCGVPGDRSRNADQER